MNKIVGIHLEFDTMASIEYDEIDLTKPDAVICDGIWAEYGGIPIFTLRKAGSAVDTLKEIRDLYYDTNEVFKQFQEYLSNKDKSDKNPFELYLEMHIKDVLDWDNFVQSDPKFKKRYEEYRKKQEEM